MSLLSSVRETSVSALNPHFQSQYTLVLSLSKTFLESGPPIDRISTMPGIPYRKGRFERDDCLMLIDENVAWNGRPSRLVQSIEAKIGGS